LELEIDIVPLSKVQDAGRRETIKMMIPTEARTTSEEGYMCPACIANIAVIVAGAASTGGILAVCIGKIRRFFRASGLGLFQNTKEK
jgi:hypothetical protein